MAKARPKNPARDRAIAAFKKAHPAYNIGITAHKRRSESVITVRGHDNLGCMTVGVWSYKNNGCLERVS